jgi:dihydrofolate reductase
MNLTHIVAYRTSDRGIGYANKLLYNIKDDLKHFKSVTDGHVVLMGRKTWESLSKKPLPNRLNVVISKTLEDPRAIVFNNIDSAIQWCKENHSEKEVFVIGGQGIYNATMDKATSIIATEIRDENDKIVPADTFYPLHNKVMFTQSDLVHVNRYLTYSIVVYR